VVNELDRAVLPLLQYCMKNLMTDDFKVLETDWAYINTNLFPVTLCKKVRKYPKFVVTYSNGNQLHSELNRMRLVR
jgi:hypothetical protein